MDVAQHSEISFWLVINKAEEINNFPYTNKEKDAVW